MPSPPRSPPAAARSSSSSATPCSRSSPSATIARAVACRSALAAAEAALTAIAALPPSGDADKRARRRHRAASRPGHVRQHRRRRAPRLHGDLGRVNEASRLEALCKPLATSLALSESFVRGRGRRPRPSRRASAQGRRARRPRLLNRALPSARVIQLLATRFRKRSISPTTLASTSPLVRPLDLRTSSPWSPPSTT